MPYSIKTADGIVVDGIPDDVDANSDGLRQHVGQIRAQIAAEKRNRINQSAAADMGAVNWALANVGAGMDHLWQGGKQLASKIGIGDGPSDDQIRDKRQLDASLAGDSGGAKGLQIAGEVAPMMVIPGAAFARPVGALARVAPMGPLTQLMTAGAVGGGASAAISPVTSDESRGGNMMAGSILGALIPGGGAAVPGVKRSLQKLLTDAGAKTRAVETIANGVSNADAGALADRLSNFKKPTLNGQPVDVPTSAAQATGDARLAQSEAFSRSRPSTQPNWADFDSAQNAQRYGLLEDMAPSDLRLDRLTRARDLATTPLREGALSDAAARGNVAQPVLNHAEQLLAGDSGANDAVRSIASYVQRAIGPDATPGRLYEARKFLASKLSGPSMPGDEMSAAAKSARKETMGMIDTIDDAIAGGQKEDSTWGNYLSEYGTRSAPIVSGHAQRDIVDKLAQKPLRGTAPEVTATGFGQALRQFGQGKFGDKLTPEAAQDAGNFLDHLKQAESASRTRKAAATMGGGSITNTDQLLAQGVTKVIHSLPGVGGYASRLGDLNRAAVESHMARLLQSPGELGDALRALPPDRLQGVYGEVLRASGLGAAAEVTSQ